MIFLNLKFWPKVIFLGRQKNRGIFQGCEKKDFKGFFAKKRSNFFGYTNSEVVISLGIKYEPLSPPPPPPPPPHR